MRDSKIHLKEKITRIQSLYNAQLVKNPPSMWETWVQSLGWEDPLEQGKATHSSIVAWKIWWTIVHGIAKSQTQLSDFHFHFFYILLFATPWTIHSMEFFRPENWNGSPFPFPGDLPNPGIKPRSPTWQADSLPAEPQGKPKEYRRWLEKTRKKKKK